MAQLPQGGHRVGTEPLRPQPIEAGQTSGAPPREARARRSPTHAAGSLEPLASSLSRPKGPGSIADWRTKTEAQAFLRRIVADIQRGDYIDPADRRRRLRHWSTIWWNMTVRLRLSTRCRYWQILERQVTPYFGHPTMGAIAYLEVEQFIAAKLRQGHSPKKVRDAVSVVSFVMKCAVRANARNDCRRPRESRSSPEGAPRRRAGHGRSYPRP